MKNLLSLLLGISLCYSSLAIQAQVNNDNVLAWQHKAFSLTNLLNEKRIDEVTCIDLAYFPQNAQVNTDFIVLVDGIKITNQRMRCLSDKSYSALGFIIPFAAKEVKTIDVYWLPQVTVVDNSGVNAVAELQVRVGANFEKDKLVGGQYIPVNNYDLPKAHTIGNKLFKYEGIGWESNKIAYRYYFDNRGAIDIFAKQKQGLFLAEIGQDGNDYHVLNDWGMDVLKVGPSLGLGGIAAWHDGAVIGATRFSQAETKVKSGSVAATVDLSFSDWEVGNEKGDLQLSLQINAQSELTQVSAKTTNSISTWATGIVKHGVNVISNLDATSRWNYLATWGKQSLNNDNLGMAIFFKHADLMRVDQDEVNKLVLLNTPDKTVEYYFSANWALQPDGANSQADFEQYLQNTIKKLNSPITVLPIE